MKKFISILVSAILITSCCLCAFATETTESGFTVKIVHTNDIHSRVIEDESGGIIGLSKIKTLIDNYTEDADLGLALDSGDIFHGQSIATLVEGESVARLIGACGYDAMTVGNHDWNYGKDRLKELVNIVNQNNEKDFSLLAGNVINNDGSRFFNDEYLIKTVEKNGENLKIGIFGLIDPNIYGDTAPSNVSGLVFTDMKEYSEKAVEHLEGQGCQLIIALAHAISPKTLATEVDGVDLWLTGHEHTDINETVTTPNGGKSLVVENGYYLYEAGLIELNCDVNGENEIENLEFKTSSADYTVCADLEPDAAVQKLLDDINAEQSVILQEVVGSTPVDLDGVWEHLRIGETTMGRAITDAYLLETGADVAFENAGGVRSSIDAGEVTYGDVINVLPFGNYIVTKQVTGKDLLNILETSIDIQIKSIAAYDSGEYDAWPDNSGSYLQVGGMKVEYNLSNVYGKRVASAYVGADKLDENKIYTVATNNFAAVSSDYPMLATKEERGEYSACDEALINFFKQDDNKIIESVSAERMISVSEPPVTQPTTVETQPSSTEAITVPANTDATSSTSNTVKPNKDNNVNNGDSSNIATGKEIVIYSIAVILIVSVFCIYFFRRKLVITECDKK